MRDIKFRAWNKKLKTFAPDNCNIQIQGDDAHVSFDFFDGNFDTVVWYLDDVELMQFTGLKDKNGVEIYEGDLLNIFYTSKQDQWFFDGVYRVSITPTGVKLTFAKLLWESHGYNQAPYESADVSGYDFVRSDYKNKNEDFRLCVAESGKWNYSNYFEVIGNIHENPELLA